MYKVNGEVKTLEEVLGMIEENIDEESYDEMLNEVYGEVVFGTLSYLASQVLEAVDPIAYRCGFLDYVDHELYGNIKYELERMDDGKELEFYGVTVEFTDEEEDEEEESSK